MNQTYMKEKKIFPLVMSMALPMMLSMAFNSLYNIVDSYFVAKLSEDAMTALSLVYPAQNLLTAVAVGFGVGVNAMISFYLGAQNQEKADKTATQGMVLGVLHGVLLMILFLCGMNWFLGMFTKSDTVRALGMEYSNVVFLFSTIVTGGITLEKIFQAVGRMRATMVSMIAGFVTNIVLDPLLIIFPPFCNRSAFEFILLHSKGTAFGRCLLTCFYSTPTNVSWSTYFLIFEAFTYFLWLSPFTTTRVGACITP